MKNINLKLKLNADLESELNKQAPGWVEYKILKKSVDARKKSNILIIYSIDVYFEGETPETQDFKTTKVKFSADPVVIVGTGPAGLFAALRLVESGVPVVIVEQGSETKERLKKINEFWRYGKLSETNNVCFGEGGAGLFSDGKLITRIKSPHIPYVMQRLVDVGAPEEILYLANPHVGSDKIRRLIPHLREKIKALGGEFLFETQMQSLIIKENEVLGIEVIDLNTNKNKSIMGSSVILATGHSAMNVYESLKEQNVEMLGQSFALGLRVEHPRDLVNEMQYGNHWEHPNLETANYKLSFQDKAQNVGIYSFCMCPGGYVLNTSTHNGYMGCNGMSNYRRNSPYSNSAIVVTIDYEKYFGEDHFKGLGWRSEVERTFYESVKSKELPAQNLVDFLSEKESQKLIDGSSVSGAKSAPLHSLLPQNIYDSFLKGIEDFNKKMKGFISEDCLLYGVESRTSSPLRIQRDTKTFESTSHKNLYPAGEGAGYAGGITSAACDGVRIAEQLITKVSG